jgi:CDP-glucose 4,6-dehydratase
MEVTPAFWRNRRVFVTGHTGFKGAWLSIWLAEMGADVSGYALAPATEPNLFTLGKVAEAIASNSIADIRDLEALRRAMRAAAPEVVIHMAAQPLVRESYADPIGTYATNVMGTAHVLEVARGLSEVRAVVVVTTDKCYRNNEWPWGYREIDRLGGRDPYSNSKACAELVVDAYRQSFFLAKGAALIASARAGNVIGGGDWSKDRLVPDIVRGCCSESGVTRLRNPNAVRPWQHVLEPLRGYLVLAEHLMTGAHGEAWNFGPDTADARAVSDVATAIVSALGEGKLLIGTDPNAPHEAMLLQLDCTKARTELGWHPRLDFTQTIDLTSSWYGAWRRGEDMAKFTRAQIAAYIALGESNTK